MTCCRRSSSRCLAPVIISSISLSPITGLCEPSNMKPHAWQNTGLGMKAPYF